MLLLHQAGSVKVGEVVRYTLTYTPSNDRILPTPQNLHVKIKNTSAIPLRAAWVHGPYALHVSAYPSSFNPYAKAEDPEDGLPQYEPMLKAGGSWTGKLKVPENIRQTGSDLGRQRQSMQSDGGQEEPGSVTWIIEVQSQILFSSSASVNFEVLVGRDERSLDLGFAAVAGHGHGGPGQVQYLATESEKRKARQKGHVQNQGVYSKAVKLVVEDTEVLWDKPPLPTWEEAKEEERREKKRKKIHLVIVTHGMHSNIGADMLFLKESIDATVKQARVDQKKRRDARRQTQESQTAEEEAGAHEADRKGRGDTPGDTSTQPLSGGQEDIDDTTYDSDEGEETIVRGFQGNAVRTENGIQYLGKRLAKYILRLTYPDQPYLPVKKPFSRTVTDVFKTEADKAKRDGMPAHAGSSVHHPQQAHAAEDLPYKFTSISFIGHSLGGLIQTYAVAYIHKHNPTFFQQIKPVNFICLASPMLGLSNENPMYVKFALDFGLVGRTGQDLGLTWRAPTLARGGWNAMIGGFGSSGKDKEEGKKAEDPATKPLLRILPTGPAHKVLRMFRNRTVYSNVVNDGIVPLRTSCLLFLDWRGLGKVDKARRENGLIGTVAEWGWAELTGQNQSALRERVDSERDVRLDVQRDAERDAATSNTDMAVPSGDVSDDSDDEHVKQGEGETVPQPDEDETTMDNKRLTARASYDESNASENGHGSNSSVPQKRPQQQESSMWDGFLSFFKGGNSERAKSPNPQQRSKKTRAAVRRGQTIHHEQAEQMARGRSGTTSNPTMRHSHHDESQSGSRPGASRGDSYVDEHTGEPQAPPKTSIFESAGDILHPPLPSKQWITDPTSRARTIFHDRVYHPEDIPPPPAKRQTTRFGLSFSSSSENMRNSYAPSTTSTATQDSTDSTGMKVEEKIARAYHRDLSWRKVLVRLEPDAHNNMVVRRMFANAYGWPVIKHLCDTHFGDTHAALTRDEDEAARERARPMHAPIPESGEEVAEQTDVQVSERSKSEMREAKDELAKLEVVREGTGSSFSSAKVVSRPSSGTSSGLWDDTYFEDHEGDDSDVDERNFVARMINPHAPSVKQPEKSYQPSSPKSTSSNGAPKSPRSPTTPYTDGHRGLSPTTSRSGVPRASESPKSERQAKANVDDPVIANRLVEEPETLGQPRSPTSPGSSTEPGLRKRVEVQFSPSKAKGGGKETE